VLCVDGPVGAIDQIRLVDRRYVPLGDCMSGRHTLRAPGSQPRAAIPALLDLLGTALTIPCRDAIDFALALDWYKKVTDGVQPNDWDNTDLADLVHRGKYWYRSDAAKLREVGLAVVGELAEFIAAHPLLREIEAIAAVPGHDSRVLSFGSRIAHAVALHRNIDFVRCTCSREFRTPTKKLGLDQRADALAGLFSSPPAVAGKRVLIVDDVYSSGATAHETARAMRAAGATRVAALAAVRTMRSR